MPRLETVENCILVSQMVVQGMWNSKSPLLQLPHVEVDTLRLFKKVLGLMLLSIFASLMFKHWNYGKSACLASSISFCHQFSFFLMDIRHMGSVLQFLPSSNFAW